MWKALIHKQVRKKTDAKNAVDEALKAKEAAIDANNDLTAEEKAKAKGRREKRKPMQRSKQLTTRQQMQR